jgi:isopenicillin N synthase-like dioxygenase
MNDHLMDTIPVIDLSQQDEDTTVRELMNALETIGFATLVHHGVPTDLMQQAFQASGQFFALDEATKLQYKYQDQSSNRGYIRCGAEHHDDHLSEEEQKQSDCKETMDIGYDQEEGYTNMWPHDHDHLDAAAFKRIMVEYFDTMDKLQLKLMRYIGLGLQLPDPDYLVRRCNGHHENLRLLHYPETRAGTFAVRGNAHTDFGTLTLLVQDHVGGLKVQRTDGTWIDVQPTKDSIIVNVGDVSIVVVGSDMWKVDCCAL